MAEIPAELANLEQVFGAEPGADQVLIDWEPMCAWFDSLAEASLHLLSEVIGESTDGREMRLLTISSPDTIERIDEIRSTRDALTDHNLLTDPEHAHGRQAGTKPVLLITAGIHATEVGGVQMMPALVRDLVTLERFQTLLENIIVLIVPTLNPDGMQLVHDWYKGTIGTASEGVAPPALYHQYAGHDNNRDWYQHHLQETRVIVEKVHNVWRPHVVLDLHQMGSLSPRYVVPPYIDPVEPHVHPLISQLSSELGAHIASAHVRAGNTGVHSGVLFDCYSPTRAYQQFHGGVRILAEAASAGIASPVTVSAEELNVVPGVHPVHPGVACPLPWIGTSWHLSDIIDYHRTTTEALIGHMTATADQWIKDQWRILSDQIQHGIGAWVIDPLAQQVDAAAARELIDLLIRGSIHIEIAEANDNSVSAGSFVIHARQPFGSYAAALLELTLYPTGSQSYDVTSHCLPIHMGVDAGFLPTGFTGETRELTENDLTPYAPATAADIEPGVWLAIDPRSHASIRLVNHALRTGSAVQRLMRPAVSRQRLIPAGSWLICDASVWDIMAHAAEAHVRTWIIDPLATGTTVVRSPRIGIYDPQHVGMHDYGWLSLWCERSAFAATVVTSEDIVHGMLDQVDTLLFPHGIPDVLVKGHSFPEYPRAYAHGLSNRVISQLRAWMHQGGHLIAFEGAATALAERFGYGLKEPLKALEKKRKFASSGAVVAVVPNPGDELMLGLESAFPAMHLGTAGYQLSDTALEHSSAKFSGADPVVSGMIEGIDHLAGLHAIVQKHEGAGMFTAFAFRPHFRTQMLASELPLVNAIFQPQLHSGENDE